ncbi:MAG: TadE-like protein [Clostridia bacterium]|jgi:Flp pilus assembly protein TadG|nr:TadE-like protein [Clostridia bacterium]
MSSLKVREIIMKNIKNQRGQALVEFAVILPLLLLLIMGIIQFGLVMNAYLTTQNAAREGARAGIVGDSDTEVKNIVSAVSPNLSADKLIVNITPAEGNRISGETLTVQVSYNYPITIPIIDSLLGSSILLNAKTTMRIE